jgi:hypothetical protein
MPKPIVSEVAHQFLIPMNEDDGQIKLGRRNYPVKMSSCSRLGCNLRVSPVLAKKLKIGQQAILTYQQTQQVIVCKSWENIDADTVEMEFRWDEEAFQENVSYRPPAAAPPHTVALRTKDPYFGLAIGIFIAILLLVLPGWGEDLGTSESIAKGCEAIVRHTVDTFKSFGN